LRPSRIAVIDFRAIHKFVFDLRFLSVQVSEFHDP
jgi:hypothetical protein